MSSSAALNTFRNGDTSTENFTSLQQTLIRLLADKDKIELYNFEYGNTAAPGITAGSLVSVNYILYPFDSTELAQYLATNGAISAASSAPDGEYVIIAKPFIDGDDAFCNIYLFPFTEGNVEYRADYGGYYVAGTQWRVLGGALNNSGSWTKKWRYQLNGSSGERTTIARNDPTFRMYADGADILFRRIRAYNPNIIATPISNYAPTTADGAAGVIPTVISIQFPCILHVWVHSGTVQFKKAGIFTADSTLLVGLVREHTNGDWIDMGVPGIITPLNNTYSNKSVYVDIPKPGNYKLRLASGNADRSEITGYGPSGAIYEMVDHSPGVGLVSASVLAVFGSTVDY